MTASRRTDRERGNTLVLLMIVLAALATMSELTVVSVQGGIETSNADHFHSIAVTAAESGVAATMDFLRGHVDPVTGWSAFVSPGNSVPASPAFAGNGAAPGTAGNPFSLDQRAWFAIEILNNRNDTGFAAGVDSDSTVVIRSSGYGPQGATAVIEVEVHADSALPTAPLVLIGWHLVL